MTTPPFDIRTLLDPAVYPWPVDEVRLIETHISWVLLAGDRVVKLKRPVDLGFVDFRDPAARKRACENEVRLNRRLTDDIYLKVVPVTAEGVDGPGEPLEWATLMRRMPADRMLDVLLTEGDAPHDLARLLAERLIPFHYSSLSSSISSSRAKPRDLSLDDSQSMDEAAATETGEVSPLRFASVETTLPPSSHYPSAAHTPDGGEILRVAQNDNEVENSVREEARWGTGAVPPLRFASVETTEACPADPETYLTVLTDNLAQLAEAGGDILGAGQLARVAESMRAYMEAERDLLAERLDAWLVEGHGDLRCEHICVDGERLQIYDCVEFEIAIRCADVASDLAFLCMDLWRLDARSVAEELLERYRAAGFDLPQPVIELYAAHRALVRAKVAALERFGKDPGHDRASAFEAASYLDLASACATPVAPMLVLVSGLSGSGKSTVAAAIGRITGGIVIASDRVRKELAGMGSTDSAASEWHHGIYSADWTARTYDRMQELAIAELDAGRSAVLDATFLGNDQRERFVEAARERTRPVAIVWTELEDGIARARIERRARERNDPSDATFAIRERQQELIASLPPIVPEGAIAVTLETNADGPPSRDPFIEALDSAGLLGSLTPARTVRYA